jgi:hypothetical protein
LREIKRSPEWIRSDRPALYPAEAGQQQNKLLEKQGPVSNSSCDRPRETECDKQTLWGGAAREQILEIFPTVGMYVITVPHGCAGTGR